MSSFANFTLDDNEEPEYTPDPLSSLPPVALVPGSQQPTPEAVRPVSPISINSQVIGTTNSLSVQLRVLPKLQIDEDLGVSTLAQVSHVLQENQQRIEETETKLQALMRQHARLIVAERHLEQQKVLDAVSTGPELGYDAGRPIASLLVYRCCLRWGCFTGDSQAAAVLDNLNALFLSAIDEDAILARTMAAARAQAGFGSGGGAEDGYLGEGHMMEQVAVEAATREVAYWLTVTSTLLALVEPLLPLTSLSRAASGAPAPAHGAMGAGVHVPTPLAAVAGDARASVARAASVAAAKVQELQKRMGNTFSGMQMLGRNLLMRRRGKGDSSSGQQQPGAASGTEDGHGQGLEGASGAGSNGEGPAHAAVAAQMALPAVRSGGVNDGNSWSPCPTVGGPELHAHVGQSGPAGRMLPGAPATTAVPCSLPYVPQVAFRQQLDLVVQKTYVQMRDSLKRHVSAVLPGCVQQPGPSSPPRAFPEERLSSGGGEDDGSSVQGGFAAGGFSGGYCSSAGAGPGRLQSWIELISVLSHHLALLREAHVPRILIRCLFKQTLAFVDVQLFNQLLLRPDCCSTSNARYLVEGLQLLDCWLTGSGTPAAAAAAKPTPAASGSDGAGPSPGQMQAGDSAAAVTAGEDLSRLVDDLKHIRQAVHFLVLANKGALRLDDFTAMCPALNMQQLYRLATTFWDDSPLPPPPPPSLSPPRVPLSAAPAVAEPPVVGISCITASVTSYADEDTGEASKEPARSVDSGEPTAPDLQGTCPENDARGLEDVGAPGRAQEPSIGEMLIPNDAVMEAAEAAVAAAAAAAAADEAGSAPAHLPTSAAEAVSRNVSGEVLEEMKRRHSVANNGGLIVTFLLDEDGAPLIVQGSGASNGGGGGGSAGGGGVVARQLLQVINEPRLHEGLAEGLPPALCSEDCPPQVFAFMLDGKATPVG